MTVGMAQLHVVRRVRTASAAPNPMMDLPVLLCRPQRLTTDPTSSPLFLREIFDPTATCQRLGQLPTQPRLQVPRQAGLILPRPENRRNDLSRVGARPISPQPCDRRANRLRLGTPEGCRLVGPDWRKASGHPGWYAHGLLGIVFDIERCPRRMSPGRSTPPRAASADRPGSYRRPDPPPWAGTPGPGGACGRSVSSNVPIFPPTFHRARSAPRSRRTRAGRPALRRSDTASGCVDGEGRGRGVRGS
jgi:hypothetical protein